MLLDINSLRSKYSEIDITVSLYEQAWNDALTNLSEKYLPMKEVYNFKKLLKSD